MREGPLGLLADCANAPKWSIPNAPRSALVVPGSSPGPGEYDVGRAQKAVRPQCRDSSFARASKAVKGTEYSELGSNVTKPSARVKGGVLRRAAAAKAAEATPGPAYCPPSSLRRQGAVYMGDDFPMPKRQRPGSAPTVHFQQGSRDEASGSKVELKATPGYSFGTSQRDVPLQQSPDTMYMPPSTLKKRAASCCNGHRPESSLLEMRPDPHTYAAPALSSAGRSFAFAKRWSSEPQLSLGPGTYQTELAQHVKGVVKMSTAERFVEKELDVAPGPGAYDLDSLERGGGNRTTFARAPRQEAPKEYSSLAGERRARVIRSFFRAGTLPPGTLRSRAARLPPRCQPRRKAKGDKEPGPGSFEAAKLSTKNACPFKTSPRWSNKKLKDPGPGPGSYHVELESRPKLGKLPRNEPAGSAQDDPGPGPDYKVYTLFPED